MTPKISVERIFSLSCFEGLRLVRYYRIRFPNYDTLEIKDLIENVEADGESLDLSAALHLDRVLDENCPLDGIQFYQSCIKSIQVTFLPSWSKLLRQGRTRFTRSLNSNEKDVFTAAGLLDDPPSQGVVEWWDDVSSFGRMINDRAKLKQGRHAEMLTLEYEKTRLLELGINRQPEWLGLDDNFAGYDVMSYDLQPQGVANRLIEVKSTTVSPLRFYITRNEWKQAEASGNAYCFHVWDMSKNSPNLHVRSVEEVARHIPTDRGKGMWNLVEIPVGPSRT